MALFDPLFTPYACRCGDASAGVFRPFPLALLHASVGPGTAKMAVESGGRNGTAFNAEDAETAEKGRDGGGKATANGTAVHRSPEGPFLTWGGR